MKVDHALRDLYDHEATLRILTLIQFLMLGVVLLAAAIDDVSVTILSLIAVIMIWSLSKATYKHGWNRRFWQYTTGGLNGVPLKEKQEKLEEYHITNETDLEDLEP